MTQCEEELLEEKINRVTRYMYEADDSDGYSIAWDSPKNAKVRAQMRRQVREVISAMNALFPAPKPEAATVALRHAESCEPVAWRYRYEGGKWVVQKNKPHWYKDGMADVEIEPLFTVISGGADV